MLDRLSVTYLLAVVGSDKGLALTIMVAANGSNQRAKQKSGTLYKRYIYQVTVILFSTQNGNVIDNGRM